MWFLFSPETNKPLNTLVCAGFLLLLLRDQGKTVKVTCQIFASNVTYFFHLGKIVFRSFICLADPVAVDENGSDDTKRERLMPDLCVICLEQEYNAVFVP